MDVALSSLIGKIYQLSVHCRLLYLTVWDGLIIADLPAPLLQAASTGLNPGPHGSGGAARTPRESVLFILCIKQHFNFAR
jgi:hypothetical protein